MQWREWSGYFASSVYADAHDIEYNAIREAAALIDVSPLYKYLVSGPDALRLVDRVVTRDATKLSVGGVIYTPWCDENGKVVDDGTIHRLDERLLPLDGRRPAAPLAAPEQRRARRRRSTRRPRRPPRSPSRARSRATSSRPRPASRSRTCATSAAAPSKVGKVAVDVSRTGYTGDLGYELWIPAEGAVKVWDALMAAGAAVRHPAGRDARPRRRPARGRADPDRGRLHVGPPRDEPRAELLARRDRPRAGSSASTRATSSAGSRSSARRGPAAPRRRLVGLQLDWYDIEGLYDAQGLPPAISPTVDRAPGPGVRRRPPGRPGDEPRLEPDPQAGDRAGLGRAAATRRSARSLSVEWTVEGRRGRVAATVVELPFLDLRAQARLRRLAPALARLAGCHPACNVFARACRHACDTLPGHHRLIMYFTSSPASRRPDRRGVTV